MATAINVSTSNTFIASDVIDDKLTGIAENDVDFFEVQLDAGNQLRVDIDARVLGSPLDRVLRLFDEFGNELAVSDDDTAPGESFTFDSFLDFTVASAGTYYIGVSSSPLNMRGLVEQT